MENVTEKLLERESKPEKIKNIKKIINNFMHNIKSVCKKMYSVFSKLSIKLKIVILGIFSVLFLGLVALIPIKNTSFNEPIHKNISVKTSVNAKNDLDIAKQMQVKNNQKALAQRLESKLSEIQNSLNQQNLSSQRLSSLESQMYSLSLSLKQMKENTKSIKSASLNSARISEKNQLETKDQVKKVQSELLKISKAVTPTHYLPVSDLPFKVVGLDFWNGKPMASIAMKDTNGVMHYRLMGQGMRFDCRGSCKSWELEKIHLDQNELLFINHQGQKIKVEM